MLSSRIQIGAAVAAVTAGVLLPAASATATVGTGAAPWTPQIVSPNSTVRQLVQCGKTMYAVGTFTQVKQGKTTVTRRNAFSFNATSGKLTGWNPNVHGTVNSIALSPRCDVAYLGGVFDHVRHTAVKNIVAVSTAHSGIVLRGFAHNTSGAVQTIAKVQGGKQLLVGGSFTSINGTARRYYVSLNPHSGAVTKYLRVRITGKLPKPAGRTMVFNQQVSPSGKHLLIEGDFTHVAGHLHLQMAQLNLLAKGVTVNRWHNVKMNNSSCRSARFYGRDAAWSPDEKTIYLAAAGGRGSSPFCDAVTAFTNQPRSKAKWTNKTGQDSLYSVAASPGNVYIGGHERWANNPQGHNSCGPGCVSRPGIGLINARSGLARKWNPTRSRGHGADDLVITRAGLWVASDNFFGATQCAGSYHPGICFFPGRA